MLRSLLLLSLLSLLFVGCSSGASGTPADPASTPGQASGPCSARSGSYLAHQEERAGGSCGPVADSIVVIDRTTQQMIQKDCTGEHTISTDNCSVVTDLTCALMAPDGTPATGMYRGTVTWSQDGTHGSGTIEQDINAPTLGRSCSSLYDIGYAKQLRRRPAAGRPEQGNRGASPADRRPKVGTLWVQPQGALVPAAPTCCASRVP